MGKKYEIFLNHNVYLFLLCSKFLTSAPGGHPLRPRFCCFTLCFSSSLFTSFFLQLQVFVAFFLLVFFLLSILDWVRWEFWGNTESIRAVGKYSKWRKHQRCTGLFFIQICWLDSSTAWHLWQHFCLHIHDRCLEFDGNTFDICISHMEWQGDALCIYFFK